LDIDYCKAISAAIFNGNVGNIVYKVVTTETRFLELAAGNVDVLLGNTAPSIQNDVKEATSGFGFTFSQPYFYAGLTMGGVPPYVFNSPFRDSLRKYSYSPCPDFILPLLDFFVYFNNRYGDCAAKLDSSSAACQNLKLCVTVGGGFEDQVRSKLFPAERFVVPVPQSLGLSLTNGVCNAVAGSFFDVIPSAIQKEYDGVYEVDVNRFSKQPLALVTREDDHQWSQLVYWINAGLFYAEERNITLRTAANEMPVVETFGPLLKNMFHRSVSAVGNYGEIYARHVQGEAPRGGLHLLNNLSGPQLYPSPGLFGEIDSNQGRKRRVWRRLRK
jgi:general L-amino acid transport system substrate-binding protein